VVGRPVRAELRTAGDLLPLHQRQPQLSPQPRHRPDPTRTLQQIPHSRRMPAHLPGQNLDRLPGAPAAARTSSTSPGDNLVRTIGHHPSLREAKIMKCCDDPFETAPSADAHVAGGDGSRHADLRPR
jgi:hypothetical protein